MAYLVKGNKPDLLEISEKIGVKIDPSSKVTEIKKLILNSQLHVKEEVKIILDRVISDRKEQERIARQAKQHELECFQEITSYDNLRTFIVIRSSSQPKLQLFLDKLRSSNSSEQKIKKSLKARSGEQASHKE
ncbi:hypothetical protein NPIL_157091 [Nephila pilipes]|uniref:Uncharacterized protein n=1 Tax=Nephila pilipes TaxID=299642 RepID=A0A8X6TKM7_NEPPI|nr:hypothetical protein NPIL_157091 [Nephila pilipes]